MELTGALVLFCVPIWLIELIGARSWILIPAPTVDLPESSGSWYKTGLFCRPCSILVIPFLLRGQVLLHAVC
jgi:hypothetical protein